MTEQPFDIKTVELPSLMAERMARSREFEKYGIKVYVDLEDFGGEDGISISINKIIEATKLETFQKVIATLETLHISPKLVAAQADTIKELNKENSELKDENRALKRHVEILKQRMNDYMKIIAFERQGE